MAENEDDNYGQSIQELKERIALQEVEIGLLKEKKGFLEDEEDIQDSKLGLAKKRLEELRKEILAMGDLKNLSDEERESMEERLRMLQDTVKLEGARAKAIKDSKAASEQLNNTVGTYFSQITGINEGWKQTAMGGMLQAAMTQDGMVGSIQKLGEAIMNLPMNIFANIVGEIEQQTVGMFKDIMGANAELVAATGLVDQNFGGQVQELGRQYTTFGLGVADAKQAILELNTGFGGFRDLSKTAQDSLKDTTMKLKALGVDGRIAVEYIDNMMKTFGLSTKEAEDQMMRLASAAQSMRFTTEQLVGELGKFSGYLRRFDKGIEVFEKLATIADKTGVSIDELTNVAKKFDTFESAARQVGQLNTALGRNVLDMQRMLSLDPAGRMDEIKNAILENVPALDSMNQHQLAFLASSGGFSDVGSMMKFLTNETGKA